MTERDVVRLGLVHTVPALGAMFHDLVVDASGRAPHEVELVHVTDPWLLREAVSSGVTSAVEHRLSSHVNHLVGRGVAGVLVTCSSLGEATEAVATRLGADRPIVRVDQGMADRAVAAAGSGGRVVVLATVESTVGPTVRLVERSARECDADVRVDVEVVAEAGRAREDGDQSRHDALVTAAIDRSAAAEADVIVLAQASMATAIDGVEQRSIPVLSSPELAAGSLVSAVGAAS